MLDQHPLYHPRQKQGGVSSELSGTAAPAPAPVARVYDKNKTVTVVSYNMERFAEDCVNVFCELSGYAKNKVGTAPTPFLEEANDPVAIFEGAPPKPKAKGKPSALAGPPRARRTSLRSYLGPSSLALVR